MKIKSRATDISVWFNLNCMRQNVSHVGPQCGQNVTSQVVVVTRGSRKLRHGFTSQLITRT